MTALAIRRLPRQWTDRVIAMTRIAVGRFHLFTADVNEAMRAALILLLLRQMAVAAEFGNLGGSGHLIGRNVPNGSAMLLAGAVTDPAIHAGRGVPVGLEIGNGLLMTRRAPVRFLGETGERRKK